MLAARVGDIHPSHRARAIPIATLALIVALSLTFLFAPLPQACADDLAIDVPETMTSQAIVPEPATLVFFGAVATALFRRRRKIRVR